MTGARLRITATDAPRSLSAATVGGPPGAAPQSRLAAAPAATETLKEGWKLRARPIRLEHLRGKQRLSILAVPAADATDQMQGGGQDDEAC